MGPPKVVKINGRSRLHLQSTTGMPEQLVARKEEFSVRGIVQSENSYQVSQDWNALGKTEKAILVPI